MLRGLHPQSNRAPGVVLHILSEDDKARLLHTQQPRQQANVWFRQPQNAGLLPGLEALRLRVAAREEAASGGPGSLDLAFRLPGEREAPQEANFPGARNQPQEARPPGQGFDEEEEAAAFLFG